MPQTGTFDTVKGHDTALVRKMLEMAVYLAPIETGALITSIVDNTNALVIPDLYESVGIMSKDDGASITPNLDVSEVAGYGYGSPIRRDTNSRSSQIAFTMTESKRRAFEVYYGIDLSAIQGSSTASGKQEITFLQPDLPPTKYWRCLCLARDGQGTGAIYHAEYFPRVTLADVAEQTFSDSDPLTWGVTLGADTDSAAGGPQRSFWSGPGMTTTMMNKMGFVRAA